MATFATDTVNEKPLRVPYNLRRLQAKLCEALDTAPGVVLESLAVNLYSEYIIDVHTKAEVLRHPGYKGADMLIDIVNLRMERNPEIVDQVLTIMSDQYCLRDIIAGLGQDLQEQKDESNLLMTSRGNDDMYTEDSACSGSEEAASPVVCKPVKVDELYTEAVSLQDRFLELLEKSNKSLNNIDNERLKLRLNWHLKCEKENTSEVKDILLTIGQLSSPAEVLNCLIHSDLIGYLNYRLLDVLQGLINDKEFDGMITKYEEALEAFLKSSDLETLAQLFLDHPKLAPETFAGLPRFTVHLDKEWEKKSTYQWNQLLKTKFNHWPAHIHIVMITKKCIILEYSVLPCDAQGIVRDLSDSQVLSTQGVTEIQLSDQLKGMGTKEPLDSHQQSFPSDDSDLLQGDLSSVIDLQSTQHEEEFQDSIAEEKNISLLKAVKQGADTATISTLLKEGANIHTTDEYGYTPLHHAAMRENAETIELLLREGAIEDINTKQPRDNGFTPLHCAALYACDSIIEILVQYGANVDEGDEPWSYTPLHLAARNGEKSTVELLLKHKADYSIQSKFGDTMLHNAVRGGNIEIMKLFLELCGASDLHKMDRKHYTPFHYAVEAGRIEAVDLLINSGVNVNGVEESRLTPLHVAVKGNHMDIAELLFKNGANIHSKDEDGCTPLHFAARTDYRLFDDIVKMLLSKGAKVNEQDHSGRTPLHYAAQFGHKEILELLLKSGANINEKDKNGFTPLHLSVGAKGENEKFNFKFDFEESSPFSRQPTLRMLLSKGAKVNEQDCYGHTPLYYAEKTDEEFNQEIAKGLYQPEDSIKASQISQILIAHGGILKES